jgi:hypothetical protein
MRATIATLCFACVAAVSGCTLPSPGFLDDYATVGGKWQRGNPTSGRVGSILSDPGSSQTMSNEAGVYGDIPEGAYLEGEYFEGEYYDGEVYYGPDASADEVYEIPTSESDFDDGVIILGEDW